jgi:hypothetical protein
MRNLDVFFNGVIIVTDAELDGKKWNSLFFSVARKKNREWNGVTASRNELVNVNRMNSSENCINVHCINTSILAL